MPRYVDGFVIPLKKSKVKAYLAQARLGGKVWMEHGALEYVESVADDLIPYGLGFRKLCRLKAGETVAFSFIVYRSRAHRDKVNAAAMKDPRLNAVMQGSMPFDTKRMAMGGFGVLVSR